MSARFMVGHHPDLGRLFAAVDPSARFTRAEVRQNRLGAMLAPYPTEEAARAALVAAGAEPCDG